MVSDVVREHGNDRRKRVTRAALRRSVLELGREQELAAVSIEAIAERAGVSARTFFNYFQSKEEAALLELFQADDADLDALGQGPPELAWRDVTGWFADDLERALQDDDFLRRLELQNHNPGLAARQLTTFARFEARMSDTVARRLGADSDARVRASLMVGCCLTAVRVALDGWARAGRPGPVVTYLAQALAVLRPAFDQK